MLKKSLLTLVLTGTMAAYASAAVNSVNLGYGSASDVDLARPGVQINQSAVGTALTVNLTAASTEGPLDNGGFIFGFTAPAGISLNTFEWLAPLNDTNNWFPDASLPNPLVVTFGPALGLTGNPVGIANLNLTVAGGTSPSILTVLNAAGATTPPGAEQPVIPGSGDFIIEVVPEPATLALLLVGGLTALRRRS